MKQLACFLFLILALAGCGTSSGRFKIEGRFLHINQGELYVYSLDGGIDGIDTIKIQGGRFAYEVPMERQSVLMIVFPNFSEQPIFAASGKSVDIKADASHLKEMEVTGTDDNKLMTKFRRQTANASPPEQIRYAEMFIHDHPESPVGVYLVRKYFLQQPVVNYPKASGLLALMAAKQPDNNYLSWLRRHVDPLKAMSQGAVMPNFKGTDVYGKPVRKADYAKGTTIISTYASWDYQGQDVQRMLKDALGRSHGALKLLSICADADPKQCTEYMKNNDITWPNVCDGNMLDGSLMRAFCIGSVPEVLIYNNGRLARKINNPNTIRQEINKLYP